MKIEIKSSADWDELKKPEIAVVVDPMVLRSGELFLRGASQAANRDQTWAFLKANLLALATFFDTLAVYRQIPAFNYGDTFDAGLNLEQRTFEQINAFEKDKPALIEVDVQYQPYHDVKTAALAELENVLAGPRRVAAQLAREVLAELDASEYRWSPDLEGLAHALPDESEKKLAKFLLGGSIFAGYARILGCEHLLQPKRSRLLLAVEMGESSADARLEDHLFARLRTFSNVACGELPWRPTFLPYILARSDSPAQAVRQLAELRHSGDMDDYRDWWLGILEDWHRHGRITAERTRQVNAVVAKLEGKLGPTAGGKIAGTLVAVAEGGVAAATGDALGVAEALEKVPMTEKLLGWMRDAVPGSRYRRLLERALIADHEYRKIETEVRRVWDNG